MVKTNLVMCRLFAGNVLSRQSKWQWLRSVSRWGASFAERRYSGSSKIIVARMGLLYNQRMNLFTQMPLVGYLSLCLGIISTTTYLLQDQTILSLLVSLVIFKLFLEFSDLSLFSLLEYFYLICIFCLVGGYFSNFRTMSAAWPILKIFISEFVKFFWSKNWPNKNFKIVKFHVVCIHFRVRRSAFEYLLGKVLPLSY